VDGECFANAASVKNPIIQFYVRLYHEDHPVRPFLGVLLLTLLVLKMLGILLKIFTQDEVWQAITDLGKEKAPGQTVSI